MDGNWSGGGVLRTSDGQEEPLRCRASYDVRDRGSEAYLNLRCASASYNFNLASQVAYSGGMISGAWTEYSRNASGTIVGRTNGRRILATARVNNFSAGLTLTTRGNRQTVSIRPYQSSVSMVSLTLTRSSR